MALRFNSACRQAVLCWLAEGTPYAVIHFVLRLCGALPLGKSRTALMAEGRKEHKIPQQLIYDKYVIL